MNYRDERNYYVEKLHDKDWYVYRGGGGNMYLFRDGKMRNWYRGVELYGVIGVNKLTQFTSERSAKVALKKYLERD